jgi:hypothetical protein
MYLVDTHGYVVDAECSLDVFQGEPCLVVESSGGADPARGVVRRNPDYNKLLKLVFERLAINDVNITRIVLDSKKVAKVPLDDRVVRLEQSYPVNLAGIDIDVFRKTLQREVSLMHRDPAAKKGGNAQKRIRICFNRVISPELLILNGGGGLPADIDAYAPGLTETERKYLLNARVGQGQFRKDLFQLFGGVCPVTGISNCELLVASHIKPWKACSNSERLDTKNGLLLSAMMDRLFDKGLISFSESGTILVSPRLSEHDRRKCGIDESTSLVLPADSLHYMEYHRRMEFKSA